MNKFPNHVREGLAGTLESRQGIIRVVGQGDSPSHTIYI
jgi:hypothetical protein